MTVLPECLDNFIVEAIGPMMNSRRYPQQSTHHTRMLDVLTTLSTVCTSMVDAVQPDPVIGVDGDPDHCRRRHHYCNSRDIQPVNFFGDSPRISLIAVLPYSRSVGGA
ncbi:hypothetical protein [Paraburkholderia aromaticivorans]|uniref:hypothetical protein n=1 Tax=Paraburkholderia aromaticivorans TaxID=2026199 RepID=UPI00145613BD|nr:hypothetical protein [Paraburkholderia aromaticivorans]